MLAEDAIVAARRQSFGDWVAEVSGNNFPREVCEHALAHSRPDRVEAVYQRGDLSGERVVLMQARADYCGGKSAQQDGHSSSTP